MTRKQSLVSLALMLAIAVPALARADKPHGHGKRVVVRDTRRVVVPGRRPVVVVQRRPVVRLHVAPPAVRSEVRVVAPSPRHTWIPGYWGWRRGRHYWIAGRWTLPPAAGRIWIEPRWVNEAGVWVFYDGYWSAGAAAPPAVVEQEWDVDVAPPPVQVEQQPPPPSPEYFWVPGNWFWDGHRHTWTPGHWEQRRSGYGFVPGHWEARGHRWHWIPGHWIQQ
jgi:hypothetical protein